MEQPAREAETTPVLRADLELAPGQVVAEKFEVISFISAGGMGSVYRVRHLLLNAEVALKVLHLKGNNSSSIVRRFQLEANAAFSLNHPNIVKVFDMGVSSSGVPFYTMELVHGITLAQHLKDNAPLPLSECLTIMRQMCSALSHTHERGVVHRDIKPANIMLVDNSPAHLKILDFGIAKLFADVHHAEGNSITATGDIFGSPLYMSPEQCSGDLIDNRSDIYSLGCVLFEMLTGTPPHVGSNPLRTMMLHQQETAPSLKEGSMGGQFPPGLEAILAKMLARKISERYNNLTEVERDLENLSSIKQNANVAARNGKRPWILIAVVFTFVVAAVCCIFAVNGLLQRQSGDVSSKNDLATSASHSASLTDGALKKDASKKEFENEDSSAADRFFEALPSESSRQQQGINEGTDDATFNRLYTAAFHEYELGNQLAARGDFRLAHLHFVKSITALSVEQKIHGYDANYRTWYSRNYGLIALCLAEQKEYVNAQRHLDEGWSLDPSAAEPYVLRVNMFLRANKPAEAKKWLQTMKSRGDLVKKYPRWFRDNPLCKLPKLKT